jgi:hypothetical protein
MTIRVLALVLAGTIQSVAGVQPFAEDSDALRAFSAPLVTDGGNIWITILTDRTVDALWRKLPAHDNLRDIAASGGTVMYAMGIATNDFDLKAEFSVTQDGMTIRGRAVNIHNLGGGRVERGETILGLIEFQRKIDLHKPFRLGFSTSYVDFDVGLEAVNRWGAIAPPSR